MILFESVRVLSWEPPAVSEPLDVAVYGRGEGAEKAGTIAEVGRASCRERVLTDV